LESIQQEAESIHDGADPDPRSAVGGVGALENLLARGRVDCRRTVAWTSSLFFSL